MSKKVNYIILAAGKGTRLRVDVAKPLMSSMGRKLVDFPIEACLNSASENNLKANIGLVVGHQREAVEEYVKKQKYFSDDIHFAHQKIQNGTGHALKTYFELNPNSYENELTYVLCADTPLIRKDHLSSLMKSLQSDEYDAAAATFNLLDPAHYGRIIRHEYGFKIVEFKDANPAEREINEVNSGLYLFKTSLLKEGLSKLNNNNKSGELYLTDIFALTKKSLPLNFDHAEDFLGVNSLIDLDEADSYLREEKNKSLMADGIRLIDSKNIYIDFDVTIGKGTIIYPGVIIEKGSSIGENCVIEAGCILKNVNIANEVSIKAFSYLEDSIVHPSASIGPYGRLRPGSEIGEGAKIGNFVEIKKSKLESGAKVSHLSYVGDAYIGANANLGCGFITCNYDGATKHKTIIGEGTFVGSDCQMVAPVEIGKKAYIAAGSTINKSVPDDGFAIARTRQVTKEKMAKKFLKSKQ